MFATALRASASAITNGQSRIAHGLPRRACRLSACGLSPFHKAQGRKGERGEAGEELSGANGTDVIERRAELPDELLLKIFVHLTEMETFRGSMTLDINACTDASAP